MHDLKIIRENPAAFDAGMKKRGLPPQSAQILKLDEEKRGRQKELDALLAKRNQLAKEYGQVKAKATREVQITGPVDALPTSSFESNEAMNKIMDESRLVNERVAAMEASMEDEGALEKLLASLPNIPADDVPVGPEETANKILHTHGKKPEFAFKPKEHFELGEKLGLMDFERAAKISGSRFVVLRGALARLERALAGFFLDHNTQQFGYTEICPPFLVRDNALFGTGQLPKFGEDLFRTTTDHWLIPTSEVPLANLVNDEIVNEADLPIRYTAYTPCFRSEAGSAGKDTRGMIRQHQFSKVELISITHPDKSAEELERVLSCAESLMKKLGLHYQVVLLSTEAGFSNKKTYDIEVWLPGQGAFREISSCSNCGDFQARRMKARFKPKEGKGTQFVHTLNGSGLPIGRTIVAILENYQQADGSIAIPEALQPYTGGEKVIR